MTWSSHPGALLSTRPLGLSAAASFYLDCNAGVQRYRNDIVPSCRQRFHFAPPPPSPQVPAAADLQVVLHQPVIICGRRSGFRRHSINNAEVYLCRSRSAVHSLDGIDARYCWICTQIVGSKLRSSVVGSHSGKKHGLSATGSNPPSSHRAVF